MIKLVSLNRLIKQDKNGRNHVSSEIKQAADVLVKMPELWRQRIPIYRRVAAWGVAEGKRNPAFDYARERYVSLYLHTIAEFPLPKFQPTPEQPSRRNYVHKHTLFVKSKFIERLPPDAFAFLNERLDLCGRTFNKRKG